MENYEDIFKNGKDFKFNKVDYSSDEITEETKDLKRKQEEIEKSMIINIQELRSIQFDI